MIFINNKNKKKNSTINEDNDNNDSNSNIKLSVNLMIISIITKKLSHLITKCSLRFCLKVFKLLIFLISLGFDFKIKEQ